MKTRTLSGWRAAQLAVLAVVGLEAAAGGTVVVSTDFETDPLLEGWGSNAPLTPEGNAWTTANYFSSVHSIRAIEALWYSPEIPLTPFEFHAASFRANATHEGSFGPVSNANFRYRTEPWAQNLLLFRGDPGQASTLVLFTPPENGAVYLDDVTIEAVDRPAAASILDALFAELPPYTFTAEPTRHAHLPLTKARLAAGQTVRIVMLGDSIVNDTSHSYFEPLVERLYPGSRVEVVTSTRNGTGCWWYRQIEAATGIPRVKTWVTDHEPDLVLIGGTSHGNQGLAYEIESIRDVMQQVRAIDGDVEFLLLTEAADLNDPYRKPQLVEAFDPEGDDWRAQSFRLADEEQVEFLDLTFWWASYILHSGQPHAWFKRDAIHMNQRGSLVAGQVLSAYFAPTTPDPDQDGMPDVTDPCPHDPGNDVDHDGLCASQDQDDDGDLVADGLDCAPASHLAWAVPGEVSPCVGPGSGCLRLRPEGTETLLQWDAPAGGTLFWYDVLRAANLPNIETSADCIESRDASDRLLRDPATPGFGGCWYYLVRARNACGVGPSGGGLPLDVPSCP